jgi:hypothetical protein
MKNEKNKIIIIRKREIIQVVKVTLLMLIFTIFNSSILIGQTSSWAGSINGAFLGRYTVDPFDNSYIAGYSVSSNLTIHGLPYGNFPNLDAGLIIKLRPDKSIDWYKSINQSGENRIFEINYSTQGDLWILGVFKDSIKLDNYNFYSNNGYGYYLAKVNPTNGQIIWATAASNNTNIYPSVSMQITSAGEVILSISNNFTHQFLSTTINTTFNNEINLLKISASGTLVWHKIISGNSHVDLLGRMETDAIGNIFLSGRTGDTQMNICGQPYTVPMVSNILQENFIVKLDPSGNPLWANFALSNIMSLSISPTKELYIGGTHLSGARYGSIHFPFAASHYKAFIGKMDSTGQFLWVKDFGNQSPGVQAAYVLAIRIGPDGNLYFGGSFSSQIDFDNYTLINPGNSAKVYYARADTSGAINWVNSSIGTSFSVVYEIIFQNSNNLIVGGALDSTHIFSGYQCLGNHPDANSFITSVRTNSNAISGKIYVDVNSSNLFDSGDIPIPFQNIQVTNTPGFASSNIQGDYVKYTDTGSYTVIPPISIPYFSLSNLSACTVNFTNWNSNQTCDLIYTPIGQINDLEISATQVNHISLNNQTYFHIDYRNKGNTTIPNASIQFTFDSHMSFVNAIPAPTQQNGNTLIWNLGTLNVMDRDSIKVNLIQVTAAPMGSFAYFDFSINPVAGDTTPVDNIVLDTAQILNGFDPNYKHVSRNHFYPDELLENPWLSYSIHFQNLGEAAVQHVVILDTFSLLLNLSTMDIIGFSHPMTFELEDNGVGKFRFSNIYLPDSTSDPLGSCGFVKYRIKPYTTIPSGNTIYNAADIYFDYNEPVRTDWAYTYIAYPVSNQPIQPTPSLKTFPNPVQSDHFNLEWPWLGESGRVEIYSVAGVKILEKIIEKDIDHPLVPINLP